MNFQVQLPKSGQVIVSVSAGYAHTVVEDTEGNTYTFGQNSNGQLGMGPSAADIIYRSMPVKVIASNIIVAGVDVETDRHPHKEI